MALAMEVDVKIRLPGSCAGHAHRLRRSLLKKLREPLLKRRDFAFSGLDFGNPVDQAARCLLDAIDSLNALCEAALALRPLCIELGHCRLTPKTDGFGR